MIDVNDVWLQYGLLGLIVAYFLKKDAQTDGEKKLAAEKYEALLKEAVTKATEMIAKFDALREDVRQLQVGEKLCSTNTSK